MALELLIAGVDQVCLLVYPTLSIEQRADAFVSTCSFQLLDEAAALVVEEKQIVLIQDGATIYFAGTVANVSSVNLADGTESLLHTVECQDYNIQVEEVVIDQLEEYGGVADNVIIDDLFDTYLPEINTEDPLGGGYVQHLHIFAEIDFYAITLREALDRIATEVESTALAGLWYINYEAAEKFLHYFAVEDNAPAWSLSDTPNYVTSFPYLSAVRKERQGAAIVNRVLVCGADVDLFVQNQDSHDYYGKWFEAIVRDNTLLGVDEVIDHGNALLEKWAYPDEAYEVITRQPGLRAGMNVEFNNTLFGTGDRVNLVENPSFEVNVADFWTFWQVGAGGAIARDNTHYSVGNFAAMITASNAGGAVLYTDNIALAAGETITVQARLWRATAIASSIGIYDVTNGVYRNTLASALTGTFEFLTISWLNDTGVAVNVRLDLLNTEADAASQVWFDGCMTEINKGPKPVEYVDGTLPYCTWDGAVHDSVSRRPPVYMIKQLTLTFPENTPTYSLTLGGKVTQTALIQARRSSDGIQSGLGPVVDGQVPLASRGWSHDLVFSAPDFDTVAWAAGDIITAANQTFSIAPGANTGAMAAGVVHYIYLDIDTSLTALQVSAGTAVVGGNIILIAVAAPVVDVDTNKATFQVFGGDGVGVMITADNIAANTITANEITGNTITAAEIAANTITAAQIFAETITATEIAADTIRPTNLLIGGFGDQIFDATDGLLLLGPRNEINITEWWTLRKQMATLSGAFHQEAGYWQGTKGLVVEEATTNLMINPSIEIDTSEWTATSCVISRDTNYARFGAASLKVVTSNLAAAEGAYDTVTAETIAARRYTVSTWVRGSGTVRVWIWDAVGGLRVGATTTLTSSWQRLELTAVFGVGAVRQVGVYTDVQQNITFYCDGFQLEEELYATTYCDGSLGTGYAWTIPLQPHDSTSTRTATLVNLDAYVDLVSGNNTLSFSFWVQMPYDADADWPTNTTLMSLSGGANDRIFIRYLSADNKFHAYRFNGTQDVTSDAQTFDAGDWIHLVYTSDYTADSYKIYINGALHNTNTAATAAPTITDWTLGHYFLGGNCGNFNFCEYAVFDRVLTADEIAMLYENNRPIVDSGSIDKPGIYILDGIFKLASSTTGNRIEITADMIAGYNSAGVKQFYLQASDGTAVCGGGDVTLDANGIQLEEGGGFANKIEWYKGAVLLSEIYTVDNNPISGELRIYAIAETANRYARINLLAFSAAHNDAEIRISSGILGDDISRVYIDTDGVNRVYVQTGYTKITGDLRLDGGLYVGADVDPDDNDLWVERDARIGAGLYVGSLAGDADVDCVWCDGNISTNGGTDKWELFDYVAGVPVATGYVEINIDGISYYLLARKP